MMNQGANTQTLASVDPNSVEVIPSLFDVLTLNVWVVCKQILGFCKKQWLTLFIGCNELVKFCDI